VDVHQHQQASLAAVVVVLEVYQHWGARLAVAVQFIEGSHDREAPLVVVISYPFQMPPSIHIGMSSVHNQLQASGVTLLSTNSCKRLISTMVWYAYISVKAGDKLAQLFFQELPPVFGPGQFGYCTAYALAVEALPKLHWKVFLRFDRYRWKQW